MTAAVCDDDGETKVSRRPALHSRRFPARVYPLTTLMPGRAHQETAIPDKDVQLVDAKDSSTKKAGAKRPQASPAPQGALKDGQEFPIGTRVRMLFDDAVWYPGWTLLLFCPLV